MYSVDMEKSITLRSIDDVAVQFSYVSETKL